MATTLTSTGITFPDATTQTTAATGGGSLQLEVFTSSGTWTAPAGITSVVVELVGGGGGGSYYWNTTNQAGHGGYSYGQVSVSGGTTYTVTVGAGGAANNGGYGGVGGTSSFSTVSATGGNVARDTTASNGSGSGGSVFNSAISSTGMSTIPVGAFEVNSNADWPSRCPGVGGKGETNSADNNARKGSNGIVVISWVG